MLGGLTVLRRERLGNRPKSHGTGMPGDGRSPDAPATSR